MNHAQCLAAAKEIELNYFADFAPERTEGGTHRSHLAWMVREMHNMSEAKAMRWLGYIQGVLVARYDVPLEEMKELSRKAVYG